MNRIHLLQIHQAQQRRKLKSALHRAGVRIPPCAYYDLDALRTIAARLRNVKQTA